MDARRLAIAEPCHADWDAMRHDGGARRFCSHCTKHVTDLSAMRAAEAAAFLEASAGRNVCVRYTREADGTVRFAADPAPTLVPLRVAGRAGGASRRATIAAPLAAGFALAVGLAGCTPHADGPGVPTMGAPVAVDGDAVPSLPELLAGDTPCAGGRSDTRTLVRDALLATPLGVADPTAQQRPPVVPDAVPVMGEVAPPPEPLMGALEAIPPIAPVEHEVIKEPEVRMGDVAFEPEPPPRKLMGKIAIVPKGADGDSGL